MGTSSIINQKRSLTQKSDLNGTKEWQSLLTAEFSPSNSESKTSQNIKNTQETETQKDKNQEMQEDKWAPTIWNFQKRRTNSTILTHLPTSQMLERTTTPSLLDLTPLLLQAEWDSTDSTIYSIIYNNLYIR